MTRAPATHAADVARAGAPVGAVRETRGACAQAPSPAASRRRIAPVLAYVGAWLVLGLWLGFNVIIGRRNGGSAIAAWEPMSWELSSVAVMAVLALGVYRFERRFPLSGAGWLRRLPAHLPAVVVFSALHTAGMVGVRVLVYMAHASTYDFGDWRLGFVYEFQKDLLTYAIIVGFCIALRAVRLRRERELALVRMERDLAAARLAQLTAQIEPHFMFNTLNAISNRMHEDVEAADSMIAAFADLLRAALSESGSAEVRVADDALWLERYFELMRERFRGRLQASVRVDPAARDARIPRLLLQPLVENAFEHGLTSAQGRVEVDIAANGTRLICRIDDDGAGVSADFRAGVGLANVRSRLELMYPHDHRFVIAPRDGGGTRVEIDLPLRTDA